MIGYDETNLFKNHSKHDNLHFRKSNYFIFGISEQACRFLTLFMEKMAWGYETHHTFRVKYPCKRSEFPFWFPLFSRLQRSEQGGSMWCQFVILNGIIINAGLFWCFICFMCLLRNLRNKTMIFTSFYLWLQ